MGQNIIHLDGRGKIVKTSAKKFLERLDGLNPGVNIYYAAKKQNCPLGNRQIAVRSRSMVGKWLNYNLITSNCHGFTIGCITRDFGKDCIWTVEQIGSFLSEELDIYE